MIECQLWAAKKQKLEAFHRLRYSYSWIDVISNKLIDDEKNTYYLGKSVDQLHESYLTAEITNGILKNEIDVDLVI